MRDWLHAGVEVVEWQLEIVDDGVREGDGERLRLMLDNATNAVVGSADKSLIQLVDFDDGTRRRTSQRRQRKCAESYSRPT